MTRMVISSPCNLRTSRRPPPLLTMQASLPAARWPRKGDPVWSRRQFRGDRDLTACCGEMSGRVSAFPRPASLGSRNSQRGDLMTNKNQANSSRSLALEPNTSLPSRNSRNPERPCGMVELVMQINWWLLENPEHRVVSRPSHSRTGEQRSRQVQTWILCVMSLQYFVGGAERDPPPAQDGTEPKNGER